MQQFCTWNHSVVADSASPEPAQGFHDMPYARDCAVVTCACNLSMCEHQIGRPPDTSGGSWMWGVRCCRPVSCSVRCQSMCAPVAHGAMNSPANTCPRSCRRPHMSIAPLKPGERRNKRKMEKLVQWTRLRKRRSGIGEQRPGICEEGYPKRQS